MHVKIKVHRIIQFVSSLSLLGFLTLVYLKDSLRTLDIKVNSWSHLIHVSWFTQMAEMLAYGFDTPVLLAISMLMAVILFYKSSKGKSALMVGTMVGNTLMLQVVKVLVHSPRPLNGLMFEEGFSFPSGHVASCTVFFGLLTYIGWQRWKSLKAKLLFNMFLAAIALILGFSRIYLNVHWLSDVLGGYFLGAFWLTFSVLVFQYSKHRIPHLHKCSLHFTLKGEGEGFEKLMEGKHNP
jgi:undecaprenyl-diphosphatase